MSAVSKKSPPRGKPGARPSDRAGVVLQPEVAHLKGVRIERVNSSCQRPWLERGVYRDRNDLTAVDSAGRELAYAEFTAGRRPIAIHREQAVVELLAKMLDEHEPRLERTPRQVSRLERVSPVLHQIQHQLFVPGYHIAPFLGPNGRPVIVAIDRRWRRRAMIEVVPIEDPLGSPEESGVVPAADAPAPPLEDDFLLQELTAAAWGEPNHIPHMLWRRGVHLAPWIPLYPNDVQCTLIAVDHCSRFVGSQHVPVADHVRVGDHEVLTAARHTLEQLIAAEHPVQLTISSASIRLTTTEAR